jgi:hypothetical protein
MTRIHWFSPSATAPFVAPAQAIPTPDFSFIECMSNIKNVNGRPVQLT